MTAAAAPASYSDWVTVLERFRDGDDEVLDLMLRGTLEWTNVVAERWTSRVEEAFDARLRQAASRLQLALDRSRGDAFLVSQALLGARRTLSPLYAAAAMPCAPAQVRDHLTAKVAAFAARTQESLESGARRDRADVLLKALRDNALTAAGPLRTSHAADAPAVTTPPARGRRILS